METLSTILSIVSIVIAVGATVLSVVFYRWAAADSTKSSENLVAMRAAVESLNVLVGALRTESFELVRSSQADLALLARQGMRRVNEDKARDPLTKSATDREGVVRPVEDSEHSPAREPSKLDLIRAQEALGRHMMKKRGSHFVKSLGDLQERIMAVFEKASNSEILNAGEIRRRLNSDEYDIGEVVYATYTLREAGRVLDA